MPGFGGVRTINQRKMKEIKICSTTPPASPTSPTPQPPPPAVVTVNPHNSGSATATMSVQERARAAVLDGASSLGVPNYAGWSLVMAGVLLTLVQVQLLPLRQLAAPAHLLYGLLLGATCGAYAAGLLIPTAPPALAALWSVQWACLGGLIFLAGLVAPTAASSNTAIVLGGPLYTASLCAALASHAGQFWVSFHPATPPTQRTTLPTPPKPAHSTLRITPATPTSVRARHAARVYSARRRSRQHLLRHHPDPTRALRHCRPRGDRPRHGPHLES